MTKKDVLKRAVIIAEEERELSNMMTEMRAQTALLETIVTILLGNAKYGIPATLPRTADEARSLKQ